MKADNPIKNKVTHSSAGAAEDNVIIQELSDSRIYVILCGCLDDAQDLKKANIYISENPDRDVILDFSRVERVLSVTISNLIILRDLLQSQGRRLILCNVGFLNKCVFTVCGLEEHFEFAEDKPAALAALESSN